MLQVENEALGKMTTMQTTESVRIVALRDEIERIVSAMEDKVWPVCLVVTLRPLSLTL